MHRRRRATGATRGSEVSFYGGMRLVLLGWTKPAAEPFDEPLAPIRPGAWAEWARASTFENVVDADLGESCLTADGRTGRIVAAFDGTRWVPVCEAV
jgi:hypothetical protein